VLSAENRAAVLRWATRRGAVVIEDDYDAEYRYDRTPVGAMQGLAPDHVVYAGSASKTLAPGLRLGWFVLPGHLAGPMANAKIAADRGSPALEQLALADLITRGEFDRHLRRMRPVYRRRRDALLAALNRRLPWLPDLRLRDRQRARDCRGSRHPGPSDQPALNALTACSSGPA
jgi:GntR family transcriptional regulator/MocR family aminotransferase